MKILGIETSFDDTGIAIYDSYKGLLSNQLYSQAKLYKYYGGVIPELAARKHVDKIIPLIEKTLTKAKLKITDIDGIAYTAGPGLKSSLLVGATVGCTLSFALQVPSIPINHIEAHLISPMLEKKKIIFPFIALLVSGKHTQIFSVTKIGKYKLLGNSLDDAVGETFDKVAKFLGLSYPGGPKLELLAKMGKFNNNFIFPLPMINHPGLDLSFSGIKTFASNIINANNNDLQTRANLAKAFEDAVIKTLNIKCRRALTLTGFKNLVIIGGVSANKNLRLKLKEMVHKRKGNIFFPRYKFCTDNGAMIAYLGMIKLKKNIPNNLSIKVYPKWTL